MISTAFGDRFNRKLLIDACALTVLALVAVLGYKLTPLLASSVTETRVAPLPGCNLNHGPCRAAIGKGQLELSISPRPVPMLEPIVIEVRTSKLDVRRIDADFAGIGMGMGYNRPQLVSQGDGRYRGETTLPVCVTGVMDWELTLLVDTGDGQTLIPFRFRTPEDIPA